MTREEAYQEVQSLIKNQNLVKHHLACEACMRALYLHFHPTDADPVQEERWGIVGLLHDADYELTHDDIKRHTLELEKLIGNKLDEDQMHAIKAHNFAGTGVEPVNTMDWSIYCCDELTGLIIASTLIHPDKKLSSMTVEFIMNRFAEPNFAKGANRAQIEACAEHLGIPLNDFVAICLSAMQNISGELGF
jgi:predicted hydrolase (HD superfamily)